MDQIYKIHHGEKVIWLASEPAKALPKNASEYDLIKPKHARRILDQIEDGGQRHHIIWDEDLAKLKESVYSCFRQLSAAGGAVIDEEGRLLMIFRKGRWDLPKGKCDRGEGRKDCAVREVEEETGVRITDVVRRLLKTYHTYPINGVWCLKTTAWYLMKGDPKSELVPEEREQIQKAEWVSRKKITARLQHTFQSVEEVIDLAWDYI